MRVSRTKKGYYISFFTNTLNVELEVSQGSTNPTWVLSL